MRTTRWTLAAVVGGALLLAGCSGSDSGTADQAPAPGYDSAAGGAKGAAEYDADSAGGGADGAGSTAERQVISTGTVIVSVDDPVTAADEVVAIVEQAQGRVDSRYVLSATEGRHASASLVVRIPSTALTDTLDRLDDVGDTIESQISAEDVTGTVQDLDARIRAKELSVTRLEALLADATTNAELIEAENALTTRQSELEELQSQRNRIGDQVAMATITVDLTVPAEVPVVRSPGFLGGLASGWASVVAFFSVAAVVLGVLLPWLVILGLALGAVILVRRSRAGRRPAPATAARPSAVAPFVGIPAAPPVRASATPWPAGTEAPAPDAPPPVAPQPTPQPAAQPDAPPSGTDTDDPR